MYKINGSVTLLDGKIVKFKGDGKTVLDAAIDITRKMCKYSGEIKLEMATKIA